MNFTKHNLAMVRRGIYLALMEIHNQIATCPDVIEYSEDIDELEQERAAFERLLRRIDSAIAKEQK